ncbi:MAG: acetate--CoA ligase family protein [Alsobacter sp.]
MTSSRTPLARLLSPRSIAVVGGREAAEVVRQCERIGFAGPIWAVNPRRDEVAGRPAVPTVEALPEAPDVAFVAVPREATVEAVAALARKGAGGAVCYASGFAEVGPAGAALQARLVAAAGEMAMLGPNCYGMINALDGAALWPDQHGMTPVERGVAIVTQSGNIGLNLTMQARALPVAILATVGNKARHDMGDFVEALAADPRVSAIGLHLEGLTDVAGFARAARAALERGVPVVVLKTGRSEVGAALTLSHTSSLAGADALYDALFARSGVARADDLPLFLETLKILHVHGPLAGRRISSMSCSGGEASLVADLAEAHGLQTPPLAAADQARLEGLLGPRVPVANPLDYHTYIWADLPASTACFAAMLGAGFDVNLLVLDLPRADRCDASTWLTTLEAFEAAAAGTGAPAAVVSSLPETLPEEACRRLIGKGIVPLQGLGDALAAIGLAAGIGEARARKREALLPPLAPSGPARMLDEPSAKAALAAFGLPVPRGEVVRPAQAAAAAARIGYPVVLKAVSGSLAHKTEAGAVRLSLHGPADVAAAARDLALLSDRLLVEAMQADVVAELIVGVTRDPTFGPTLTVGAGGVLVELLADARTLLLPASRDDVEAALRSLKAWRLLQGYRGRPAGDVTAAVEAVLAVARFAEAHAGRLLELDVNPLLVLPEGRGAVAVDALVRWTDAPA